MRQILIIAFKELGDRLRSGWVIACAVVWLGAITLTSLFGLLQIGLIGFQGYERTVVSLLNLAQYLIPLLALLLGHDLVVTEREERTLALILASGVTRTRALLGKYLGGCLTLALPLLIGFALAGGAIGIASGDRAVLPFLRLAGSGLALGIVFLGVGLLISTLARTRVQALVISLLTWCVAIFVFDLVALGLMVTAQSSTAAHDIEISCEATHVNSGVADVHADYDAPAGPVTHPVATAPQHLAAWLALNPVDVFRALNLPGPAGLSATATASLLLWLGIPLGAAVWRLHRLDV